MKHKKNLTTQDVVKKLVRDTNAQALTIRAIMNLTKLSDDDVQKESVRILEELSKVKAIPPDLLDDEDYGDDDFDGDDSYGDDDFDGDGSYGDDDFDSSFDDSYDDDSYDEAQYDSKAEKPAKSNLSMLSGQSIHPVGAFIFGG